MPARSPYNARPPGFFGTRRARLAPASAGTVHAVGWSFTTFGTVSTPTLASTSLRTQMRRTQFLSAVAVPVGLRSTDPVCWRGTDGGLAGRGGFSLSVRFCIQTGAGTTAFVGVAATPTPVAQSQPSTVTNTFGIGFDGVDTSWSVIHRSSAGGVGKDPIAGATVNSDVWDLTVLCAPGAASMHLNLVNLTTGTTLVRNAEYATNIVDGNVVLYFHAHCDSVGSTTHAIEIMSASLEVPDGATFVEQPVGRDGVYDVRDFGARGDGTTDDLPAFKAALRRWVPMRPGRADRGRSSLRPGTTASSSASSR